jgi:ribosome-associated translation inhibitor RaiA
MNGSACEITFLGMEPVEAIRVEVRAWFARLGALMEPVSGGHVFIEAVDEHRKERLYRVRMELSTPHGLVAVCHAQGMNASHDDVYVAIRNAFRAARRQLENGHVARVEARVDDGPAPAPPSLQPSLPLEG